MNKYLENLNDEIKAYFNILEPEFPTFLNDYINTHEMQRIDKIGISCGTDYSKLFNIKYWYSNLDHSIGVALIIWHFTHDKKQTLAGLFHDIATPTFKHCIDFMNGDSETQESTEERTTTIIQNSKEIMDLLKRNHIKLEEVNDYKLYPIADNDTPRLSADRFEYTFSSGLVFYRIWELDLIKKCYDNIIVANNEDGLPELCFKDKDVCEFYVTNASRIWPKWINYEDKICMQFIADMCYAMNKNNYLAIDDLYTLSEKEVIDKILNCENEYFAETFSKFMNASEVYISDAPINNKYYINTKTKRRYVNPLVTTENGTKRIYDISKISKEAIDNYFNTNFDKYVYYDFNFDKEQNNKQLRKTRNFS